jgi:hypothetical protein
LERGRLLSFEVKEIMNELVCESTTAALYVGTPASKEASLMDDLTHHRLRIEKSSFAPLAD